MRLLLALPTILLVLMACAPRPAVEEPVRAVRTITLQAGQPALRQEFAAEIRARTESRLAFRVGGKLLARTVDLGDHVAAGRVLARLDAADLKLGHRAAQAALRSAEAQLALSETEFKRFRELRDQGFISGLELERRETALKAARAQAEQARAQASVQGNQADYAVLVADAAGVVTAIEAEPGAVLAAGSPVLRLAQDGPRDAVFSVPEDQVGAFRALTGRRGALRLRLWGSTDTVPVTVREVAAAADAATRTFLVKADLGTAAVRLGQTASVLLETPGTAAITLPLAAVFQQGGQTRVWLVDPATMTVRAQPIQVGAADANALVVSGGLAPGQVVVVAGVHALNPGQKVRWYVEPGAAAPASAASGATPAASAAAPAPSAASR